MRYLSVIIALACLSASCSPPCRTDARYEAGKSILSQATAAMNAKDYARADKLLDEGIAKLGSAYLYAPILDDSGQRLGVAEWYEKRGNLRAAVQGKKEVLASRLAVFEFALCEKERH
jgi:outer membrane protein assembly factor BamD (BamD/ComL family)